MLSTSEEIGLQTLASNPQATFERWIGGSFRVSLGGRAMGTMILASVNTTKFPAAPPSNGRVSPTPVGGISHTTNVQELKSTRLEFTHAAYLPQDVYTLDHDWLGSFNVLLVPDVPYSGDITYAATFASLTGKWVKWTAA